MTGRDSKGRFLPGNPWAGVGGHTRAKKLNKRRRREIARLGWQAVTDKHFGGDAQAHKEWFTAMGLWEQDRQYRVDGMGVFPFPGKHPAHDRQETIDFTLDDIPAIEI